MQRTRSAMTPALATVNAADTPIGPTGENEEDRLDEAIQETFPASDPIAICIEEPVGALTPATSEASRGR